MSAEESKQSALVTAQSAALTTAGSNSLAARARAGLQIREGAEEWLRRGLELLEAASSDSPSRGPVNPYANAPTDLAAQLRRTIPDYIKQVSTGTSPEVAAKNLRMSPEVQETAHVAHFFMPDTIANIPGASRTTIAQIAAQSDTGALSPNLSTIPSPTGTDNGILTQATVEKIAKLIVEFENIQQEQQRQAEQLKKREDILQEAFRCFEKGHELDPMNAELLYWLAESYYHGDGVERNEEQAVPLYQHAAKRGHSQAQHVLSNCYYNGEGASLDLAQAVEWLRKAAEQGNVGAQYDLGLAYKYGGRGLKQDARLAMRWFRKAARRPGHSSRT